MSLSLSTIALATLSTQLDLPTLSEIGGIQVDTTIEEFYEDSVEVTEHPVQRGAQISDHAFKRPMELVLTCGWSDANDGSGPNAGVSGSFPGGSMQASDYIAGVYSQLLQMQVVLEPISATSGLRNYNNMMITSLRVQRDEKTRYALMVHAFLREVILVDTQNSSVPPQTSQAKPASTADTVNLGSQQTQSASPSGGGSYPVQ
jgi:hypothetical protein